MSELINSHVLLPFLAEWSKPPAWQRSWQTEIAGAVTGGESRAGLRAQPRVKLTFQILPTGAAPLAVVDDLLRSAAKNGLACVPHHGRGHVLQADCTAATAQLDRPWRATTSGYIIFLDEAGDHDVRQITGTDGNTVGFADAVSRTWRAGTFAWLLLFGKFTPEKISGVSPETASLPVTIQELVAPASAQVGEVPDPTGTGIGAMIVGTDNTIT